MPGAAATFRTSDGRLVPVSVGGLIGRGTACTLRLPDPRISEVHALVSLRGRALHLVALRGTVRRDAAHEPEDEIVLEAGQTLVLGEAVTVEVERVSVPDQILALHVGDELRELCADAYSLVEAPALDIVPWFVPGAPAHLWSVDDGWLVRVGEGAPAPLVPGKVLEVGGHRLPVRRLPVGAAGATPTIGAREGLTLVCRTTTVHLHRARRAPVTLDARAGQLLSELALMRAPVEWAVAARQLWPDEPDLVRLRNNFDAVLARLRAKLREVGVRDDLVRTDGRGNVEVFLDRADRVVDEA